MEPEFLNKIEKELPFEVPEDYFGQLPGRLSARISETRQAKPASRSLTRFIHIARAASAACFALLLSVLSVIQVEKQSNDNDLFLNIANFDEEMLVQEYLETYVPAEEKQAPYLETYILDRVDESLLLQEQ